MRFSKLFVSRVTARLFYFGKLCLKLSRTQPRTWRSHWPDGSWRSLNKIRKTLIHFAPLFSAQTGYFLREIGVFFANLCVSGRSYGQTAQFGTAFPCQIRTFCQRAGVFFPPSNRIGPNQQSKRCGEPIAFPIRVERRNHGLFPLSRTRKESFLPSGPGRRNSLGSVLRADVRG